MQLVTGFLFITYETQADFFGQKDFRFFLTFLMFFSLTSIQESFEIKDFFMVLYLFIKVYSLMSV